MVHISEAEVSPLLSKEPKHGFSGRAMHGRFKKILAASVLVTALAMLILTRRIEKHRVMLDEEDEGDDEYFGNSVGLYATYCCSPKDTSCCQATSSAPWIPGVAVEDISPTCRELFKVCVAFFDIHDIN
jgi:hypothetical protein